MGRYLAIDGPDGSGKTTQVRLLVAALEQRGLPVRHLREPGSTALGERLRAVLLDPATGDLEALTEGLLFSAARREMLVREVAPAVAAGATVVVERCFLSTLVYQSLAAADGEPRMPLALARAVTGAVHRDCWPDAVVVLDVDPECGVERVRRGGEPDRIERRDIAYHRRVRDGFVQLARDDSWTREQLRGAIRLVGGSRSVAEVHAEIRAAVDAMAVAGGDR